MDDLTSKEWEFVLAPLFKATFQHYNWTFNVAIRIETIFINLKYKEW